MLSAVIALPSVAATIHVPKDHPTIQSAVDAGQPGDTVLVAPGTYAERIRLKPRVTLRSSGDNAKGKLGLKRAEATIIDGKKEIKGGPGVEMAEGATLDGFTITGVGVYDEDQWNKHYATQGEEQSHEHIGEPGTAGVGINGVTCTVRNNIVHHIGYTGIAIMGSQGRRCSPLVERNACYRNMGGGIGSMKHSTAVIRDNICFENFYAGIGHDDASPLVVGNVCYGNIRAGIGISEGSCPIVRSNKCYKNRRAGIGTRTGGNTRPLIEDNDCYENDMAGIGTREEAAPIIRNNRCYRNKMAGIGSRTGAAPLILGNECYENQMAGIGQRDDAKTTLIGNYCHHNKTAGIGFAACKDGRSRVLNNRVIDNALVAIGINPGWNLQMVGNELARKGGLPPIVMLFAGSEATFSDNVIRGGGVAGIRVAGKLIAENNRFEGAELRKAGPPNFAVWALKGSTVALTDNQFSNWRHALSAQESEVSVVRNRIRSFHGTAFAITKSAALPQVIGNIAYSDDDRVQIINIDPQEGLIENNELKPTSADQLDTGTSSGP